MYESTRVHTQLKPEMPQEFADAQASANSKQREKDRQVADAYWNCAVTVIQWKHTYGSPLPDAPPDEFRISTPGEENPKSAEKTRLQYWHRLQRVWLSRDSWERSGTWSTQWLTEPTMNFLAAAKDYFDGASDSD